MPIFVDAPAGPVRDRIEKLLRELCPAAGINVQTDPVGHTTIHDGQVQPHHNNFCDDTLPGLAANPNAGVRDDFEKWLAEQRQKDAKFNQEQLDKWIRRISDLNAKRLPDDSPMTKAAIDKAIHDAEQWRDFYKQHLLAAAQQSVPGCSCICSLMKSSKKITIHDFDVDFVFHPDGTISGRQAAAAVTYPADRAHGSDGTGTDADIYIDTASRFRQRNPDGSWADVPLYVILGHELCGHAKLMAEGRHPAKGVPEPEFHRPTIEAEDQIRKEHGLPLHSDPIERY